MLAMVLLENDGSWSRVQADMSVPSSSRAASPKGLVLNREVVLLSPLGHIVVGPCSPSTTPIPMYFAFPTASPTQLALHLSFPADPACSFQKNNRPSQVVNGRAYHFEFVQAVKLRTIERLILV